MQVSFNIFQLYEADSVCVCVRVLRFLLGIRTLTISKQMNSLMCFFALVVVYFVKYFGFGDSETNGLLQFASICTVCF